MALAQAALVVSMAVAVIAGSVALGNAAIGSMRDRSVVSDLQFLVDAALAVSAAGGGPYAVSSPALVDSGLLPRRLAPPGGRPVLGGRAVDVRSADAPAFAGLAWLPPAPAALVLRIGDRLRPVTSPDRCVRLLSPVLAGPVTYLLLPAPAGAAGAFPGLGDAFAVSVPWGSGAAAGLRYRAPAPVPVEVALPPLPSYPDLRSPGFARQLQQVREACEALAPAGVTVAYHVPLPH